MPGTGPDAAAPPRLPRSASPAAPGMGSRSSSSGVTVSDIAALKPSTSRNRPRLRRASAPALAVATVWTTPVNSSAATSGTIVACNARNHRSPTGSATASTAGSALGAAKARARPPSNPAASAANVHSADTCAIGGSARDGDMDDFSAKGKRILR